MATSYLSPGVYVEEVDRGSKPIEAVGTNTVGFIGESAKGPTNEAVLVTNWSQFVKTFGDFKDCSMHLAHAVYGFFNNGGSRCFVVNCGAPDEEEVSATASAGDKKDDKPKTASRGDRDGRFIGRDNGPGQRSGLKCFEEIDEIAILCAPGQVSPAVQDAVLTHCETRKDRFAILDSPETISGGVDRLPKPRDSKYGAYYFPWIQVYDPDKGNLFVPPSGHIAGVYSRVDNERGVHKAPANELVRGALGLKYNVSKGEQDLLNPKGINAIRMMNGGIRIWGARTLSSDPSWKYINVRRLFIMVESSIERATQWVVFEPNDHRLWKRVVRTISSFLTLLWRNGALMGTSPEQAFFVKCDDETNPPEVVDAGQLVVEIGLAPVKPAEFVIFRIGQMPSGGGVEE
ncbi:phage tail sheath family protein [Haliangium ochraceum]|uniref:Tail sheath protein n=1 Tax=Haliangium ochraceum (strain DSM 14365 / JCM 11303 / SMP-2) TaxID=502025 RepID=D0LXB6_HALO1|nr:phage tail sheath family protein [Haliangium ochraceum]ACY16158.1 tail sheath protein [Haliangium ochraceum DSM 14365]